MTGFVRRRAQAGVADDEPGRGALAAVRRIAKHLERGQPGKPGS